MARALERPGFEPIRQKGSHVFYRHPDGRSTILPNHPGEDLGVGLLRKVLRDVGVETEEFLELVGGAGEEAGEVCPKPGRSG